MCHRKFSVPNKFHIEQLRSIKQFVLAGVITYWTLISCGVHAVPISQLTEKQDLCSYQYSLYINFDHEKSKVCLYYHSV